MLLNAFCVLKHYKAIRIYEIFMIPELKVNVIKAASNGKFKNNWRRKDEAKTNRSSSIEICAVNSHLFRMAVEKLLRAA